MDKETLSNYGWIVICVLVLAVMLALATPFGKFISNAIENTTTALFQTSKAGLGSAGIDAGELVFGKQDGDAENPDTPDASDKLIPDGGIYKKADGTTLEGNGTNTFPETPADGDEYEEGDYKYTYNSTGWSVKVKDTSKISYGEVLTEIAGKPVTNMFGTFMGCTSLTAAPTIPNSVTNMSYTFNGCTALETAPTIPNSVTNMWATFSGCTSLTTAPTIPNGVTNMIGIFSGCTSLKTYVGSTDTDGDFSNYTIPNSVTSMGSTFNRCSSLTTAPAIPNNVTNMPQTFNGCSSLTGTIEINANPTEYRDCLKNTQITGIIGSCSQETKDALLATK